jgi:outer membrane protein
MKLFKIFLFIALCFYEIANAEERLSQVKDNERYSQLIARARVSFLLPQYDEEFFENGGSISSPTSNNSDSMQEQNAFGADLSFSYFLHRNFAVNFSQGAFSGAKTTLNVNDKEKSGGLTYFPSTLSFEYYPYIDRELSPYFGLGYNYTLLRSGIKEIKFENTFGPSVHLGLDFWLGDYGINFEVRKIFIESDTRYGVFANRNITSKTTIDPFIFMIGVSYDF